MNTAQVTESIKPTPDEIGVKAHGDLIRTDVGDHEHLLEGVVAAVKQVTPSFTKEDAAPSATRPIPASPELIKIQAERTGSQILPFSDSDIKHGVQAALEPVTGKKRFGRVTHAVHGLRMLFQRNKGKKAWQGISQDKIDLIE